MQYIFIKDSTKTKQINTFYQDYLESEIAQLLENKRFEDALYIANLEKTELNIDSVYTSTLAQRERNFEKYKNRLLNSVNARKILDENQNELLTIEAVRVAYNEDNIPFMLKILQKYPIKNDTFRLKAFYLAYKIIDEQKAKELKSLILSNPTYSQELKKVVQK